MWYIPGSVLINSGRQIVLRLLSAVKACSVCLRFLRSGVYTGPFLLLFLWGFFFPTLPQENLISSGSSIGSDFQPVPWSPVKFCLTQCRVLQVTVASLPTVFNMRYLWLKQDINSLHLLQISQLSVKVIFLLSWFFCRSQTSKRSFLLSAVHGPWPFEHLSLSSPYETRLSFSWSTFVFLHHLVKRPFFFFSVKSHPFYSTAYLLVFYTFHPSSNCRTRYMHIWKTPNESH